MAILKIKDLKNMSSSEREQKLKDLKLELIKRNVTANKSSKIKVKEIKKAIARILNKNGYMS